MGGAAGLLYNLLMVAGAVSWRPLSAAAADGRLTAEMIYGSSFLWRRSRPAAAGVEPRRVGERQPLRCASADLLLLETWTCRCQWLHWGRCGAPLPQQSVDELMTSCTF